MSLSKNQHFLPVFYLNQFTDAEGCFYIFDVKRKAFKKGGKKFHPNSHFYEIHSNTTSDGTATSDFIEKNYTKHDTELAAIFRKVNEADEDSKINLSSHEWTYLQYYISILHWRLPCYRESLKNRINKADTLKQVGLMLKEIATDTKIEDHRVEELLNRLKSSDDFSKFYKAMVPGHTYSEIFNKENDFAHIREFPHELPRLVSDNPIIYRNPGKVSIHTDDLIFPLTPKRLLLRNKMSQISLLSTVRLYADIFFLVQANDYVACTDLNYPYTLLAYYEKHYKSIDELRQSLFAQIIPRQ
ncbi:DUF4238 domain-containing protein [Paraflavitalea sp. CAU 1676]|uniref:DUF4238 domain-containing protein n=1 Tax=Paraflavitalea sp. CAU 1676 TaxID=3032598 RepID=UPI0023DB33FC|nr:DUF4238 domain-containing protein [Paraflavitalea sp. CAU 1676]MDF2188698.1 DUF4238 domain-containing protein [Paraflavitalea sp. CAU 1676]